MSKTAEISRDLFVPEESRRGESEKINRPTLSYWKDALRRYKANRVALSAALLLLIIIFMATSVPVFSRYNYYEQDYSVINQTPSLEHLFGTDELGRDIWIRCWEGARVSLFIAFIASLIDLTVGILYGGISGYTGGIVDNLMMRIVEFITAVPQMLWMILLILIMKPGIGPIIVAISATSWVFMARLFRGQVFQIKQMEFVLASRTMGAGSFWIIVKHLLPNAMSPVLTNMAFTIPKAIFAEAFLSYIGLGLPLPMASWGVLASDGAAKILVYPYQLAFPAFLISITMLSFNMMGDGLRDALDPKLRN